MSAKKFLVFGKMLVLLLLVSFSVVAKTTIAPQEFQNRETISFNKVDNSFHKNMLQPQVVHVSMMLEHSAKPLNSGYSALVYDASARVLSQSTGQINVTLQDANRCESVSKLLFPFHYFW